MNKWLLAIAALGFVGPPSTCLAQGLTQCVAGQAVTDVEGKTGVIVSSDSKLCQVKYADGQIYGWIFWNLRPAAPAPIQPQLPKPAAGPDDSPPSSNPSQSGTGTAIVLKPPSSRTLHYQGDRLGHFSLTAAVNGAPIRFVVDTGASLVALTLDDARAAGFSRSELVFNRLTRTANGPVRYAQVVLRDIRIEQLSIDSVPAAVMENLDQSLLGMSFLKRLKSFEVREGVLHLGW